MDSLPSRLFLNAKWQLNVINLDINEAFALVVIHYQRKSLNRYGWRSGHYNNSYTMLMLRFYVVRSFVLRSSVIRSLPDSMVPASQALHLISCCYLNHM